MATSNVNKNQRKTRNRSIPETSHGTAIINPQLHESPTINNIPSNNEHHNPILIQTKLSDHYNITRIKYLQLNVFVPNNNLNQSKITEYMERQ